GARFRRGPRPGGPHRGRGGPPPPPAAPVAEPLWMRADVVGAVAFFKPAGIGSSPLRGAGPPAVARAGEAVQAGLDRISRRWPVAGIAGMAHHRERAAGNRTVIAAIAACVRPRPP